MAPSPPHRRTASLPYRTGAQRLPHPSWRAAVEGERADPRRRPSAAEFWSALEFEP